MIFVPSSVIVEKKVVTMTYLDISQSVQCLCLFLLGAGQEGQQEEDDDGKPLILNSSLIVYNVRRREIILKYIC